VSIVCRGYLLSQLGDRRMPLFHLLYFSVSIVLLVFQVFGVKPVAHIMMKSMCMVSWIFVGSIRRSSFTIPSGPGDLLLLRDLIHSLNALLSSIEECSQFLSLVPSDSSRVIFDCNYKGSGGLFPGSLPASSGR
jgi:hypothetical protein